MPTGEVDEHDIPTGKIETRLCNGPIKPDIVFFGESLPKTFWDFCSDLEKQKEKECDLMIVIGTALAVPPFSKAPGSVGKNVPSVLINMENLGNVGYDYDDVMEHPERLYLEGKCDATIKKIVRDCGW